jgi:hypothetical protein
MALSVSEGHLRSQAVFEGRALEVQSQAADGTPLERVRVRFRVVRAWKGVTTESIELTTANSSAACGYEFAPGQSYLVYADEENGTLSVSLCSRTQPMSDSGEDLEVLGMGATPVDPKAPPSERVLTEKKPEAPARGGCASCSIGTLSATPPAPIVTALAAALALATCRRRSRSRP